MDAIKVLQVVGYKDSGKTTLIEKWIEGLSKANYLASVVKHHGHGSPLALPPANTDSTRHFHAGALSSIAAGGGSMVLQMRGEPTFTRLLQLASLSEPDIIFVEGYKQEDEPKVVIVRWLEEWDTLRKLDNIQLVLTYDQVEIPERHIQVILLNDEASIQEWIIAYIKGEADEAV
ncbi:molybdopterin-guanine dinucleotide biosynthesis protein B [Paenibacillus sp. 1001270B_150601_E10]|uniref:molybdopterin-guanine dinucleotide biosynthesis protein B n=1 Tax=Paenibacillus sp. 1001270B_150601_E10 TaxID=2787079 RepID=UPI00189DCE49|nr:molybdopterin-guanine dinucleotide biosynthesis protein B [Paenibacillus sp. 1001270B_150601_E10]